jgi:hypothetical protein
MLVPVDMFSSNFNFLRRKFRIYSNLQSLKKQASAVQVRPHLTLNMTTLVTYSLINIDIVFRDA